MSSSKKRKVDTTNPLEFSDIDEDTPDPLNKVDTTLPYLNSDVSSPKRREVIDTTDSDNSDKVITDGDSASGETDDTTSSSDSESDLPLPPLRFDVSKMSSRTSEPRVSVKPKNKDSQTHDVTTVYSNPLNALINYHNVSRPETAVPSLYERALEVMNNKGVLRRLLKKGDVPVQKLIDLRKLNSTMKEAVELIKNVKDINTRLEPDKLDETWLIRAARTGDTSLAKWLSGVNEVDINAVDINGFTALHHACSEGNAELVSVLLTRENIDVNARDNDRHTPLRIASMKMYPKMFQSMKNYLDGYGVSSNAERSLRDYKSVVQMLKERHAEKW